MQTTPGIPFFSRRLPRRSRRELLGSGASVELFGLSSTLKKRTLNLQFRNRVLSGESHKVVAMLSHSISHSIGTSDHVFQYHHRDYS
jgi:hypothetical protein